MIYDDGAGAEEGAVVDGDFINYFGAESEPDGIADMSIAGNSCRWRQMAGTSNDGIVGDDGIIIDNSKIADSDAWVDEGSGGDIDATSEVGEF